MPELLTFGDSAYLWVKTLHVIAVITWMAGLFYLPRLFVYHAQVEVGSAQSELFKVMERRLLRGIMNPSIVVVFVTGGLLFPTWSTAGWMHAKLTMVVLMAVFHHMCMRWRLDFAADRNKRDQRFYRYANEVPTVLLLVIIPLVILKPF